MGKSHTKIPKGCNGFCKKGHSKKAKEMANRHFRRTFNNLGLELLSKGNYYRKFISWWEIQGDFGRRPCFLYEYIRNWERLHKYKEEAVLEWKKYYYFK